jgi:two-component system cell cycle response regulator
MTARILVVDDIAANAKLLEGRLSAEYFEVATAMNGMEALAYLERSPCDLVLLDVMMPGLDGFEVCRRIKADGKTAHIPVVMVTALDQPADRVAGLDAGADDFLTKPISEVALIARVRSLTRLKLLVDELYLRSVGSRETATEEFRRLAESPRTTPGRVLLVDDRRSSYERVMPMLQRENAVTLETTPGEALFKLADADHELVIVSTSLVDHDALRLCSQIRSLERTRMLPILLLADPEEDARLFRALDLGVNDYIVRPIDRNELLARVRTQLRRKRYTDALRENVQLTMEMAVVDSLTGLYNRRYLESHLKTLTDQATTRDRALSVLILDIDFFKMVNDTYGHHAGDDVIKEFARRIRKNIRGIDLACRFGGEEFVVVMPETELEVAHMVAERIRQKVARDPFPIDGGARSLAITVSVGIGVFDEHDEGPEAMMKRADQALYVAKREGRNRVVADAA